MNKIKKILFADMQKIAAAITRTESTLKFITLIIAALLIIAGSISACKEKSDCPCTTLKNVTKEKVCDIDNPLTDLPWLKEYIDGREYDKKVFKQKEQKSPYQVSIYLCSYKDGIGFLIDQSRISSLYPYLKDCKGRYITHGEQNIQYICEEWGIDYENKQLIFEITCNL